MFDNLKELDEINANHIVRALKMIRAFYFDDLQHLSNRTLERSEYIN